MNLQLTLLRPNRGRVPTFERTLTALGEIPSILCRALEFGASQNRRFFEELSQKEKPRPHLREMIVRDQAKRFLERNDFQVEEESVTVGNEPLAALTAYCGPAHLRVLKGFGGTVPGCGDSGRRKDFYNQKPGLYRDGKGQIREAKLNLLYLWDFDKTFNLGDLWLACPMRAGQTSADILLHWHEPIPYPIAVASDARVSDESRREAEDELERLLREQASEESADSAEEA